MERIATSKSDPNRYWDFIDQPSIAILIPCYNEELTVADVVQQFRAQLPTANVYVFDNNSTDKTAEKACLAGATVCAEKRQGKGYVVQSMFRMIDADVYVMVDGDATYPASDVQKLIEPILYDDADMTVGSRLHESSNSQFKSLNYFGNRVLRSVLNTTFRVKITDMMSGYRAFNRSFVKGLPLFGGGFETETELTIKALQRGYRIVEVPVNLSQRPEGSFSKIRIARDGMRILHTILTLLRDYKPLTFFGSLGLFLIAVGFIPGLVVVVEFFRTGLVARLPSALMACSLVLSGMLSITIGLILHTIARRSQELDFQLQTLFVEISQHVKREIESLKERVDRR